MPIGTVPVRVRDCACPGTPHPDGDVVSILEKLSLGGGIRAQQDILAARKDDGTVDATVLTTRWMETFVRCGAVAWNLRDEAGLPVPFDIETLVGDFELAAPVADACEERYSEAVLRPLGLSQPAS